MDDQHNAYYPDSRLKKKKKLWTAFSSPITNQSPFELVAYSFSIHCSFVYKFDFLEQKRPQNLFYQQHIPSKIAVTAKLIEKYAMR